MSRVSSKEKSMLPLTEQSLRSSFVNASRKEIGDLVLPDSFGDVDWERLDYFGWRDPKYARRAYAIVPSLDGEPIGIMFRHPDGLTRSRPQCAWCQDVRLPNDVVLYTAKRSGKAGRNGNTVGTLICRDFECSRNVRNAPPPAYEGFDVEAARVRRIEDLQLRAAAFAGQV
jgi:hypothetical protein